MDYSGFLPKPLRNFINLLWDWDTIVWDFIVYSSLMNKNIYVQLKACSLAIAF